MPQNSLTLAQDILKNRTAIDNELLKELTQKVLDHSTVQKSQELQTLLVEREKIEHEIRNKTQQLQELRKESFETIEKALIEKFDTVNAAHLKYLTQLKIESIDILDVLSEITESAFISALEGGEHIEATINEIARDLTRKTLKDGYLTLERAKKVVSTIVTTAMEIAEAAPNSSQEILRGTLYGTKRGLAQSIRTFKERFDYIPDELQPMQIQNLQQTLKDLQHTDKLFLQIVQEHHHLGSPLIQKELAQLVERMRFDMSDLVNASKDAWSVISKQLATAKKEALQRSQSMLHSKTAIEAKRMGVNIWDVAKSALGAAYSSAKESINKDKK